jgi:hypothetical protein
MPKKLQTFFKHIEMFNYHQKKILCGFPCWEGLGWGMGYLGLAISIMV